MSKPLEQIGRGTFTTAYRRADGKVLLKSRDPIKECMAWGWFPNSRLFPKIEFGDNRGEYIMNYYPKTASLKNSLKPKEYEFYLELRRIFDSYPFGYSALRDAFQTIKCRNRRRIMIEALEACANYGQDVRFEISPRNVRVSKAGNLILLDCFFIASHLFSKEARL